VQCCSEILSRYQAAETLACERSAFSEYAGESVKHSFWARAYYEQQIAKGKSRQAAVRALAYK
jgi:hypothetical protein